VEQSVHSPRLVRFESFEVDVRAGELRKAGVRLRLTGQPFQVLAILLEHPGDVVTRDELQNRLWPDTFVDVEHNLNTAINKIREVLGDSAESPRFVETLPRRGYRFVAPVEDAKTAVESAQGTGSRAPGDSSRHRWAVQTSVLVAAIVLLAAAGFLIYKRRSVPTPSGQRALTRLTFDDGLQIGATWSPDARFIAYSSNRGSKFDIWMQQVSGGDPVPVTKGPGHNWQPDWSPDGKYIAYRSEAGEGGLFVMPALGGAGLERKIASFGYYPQWSPDGSQILFQRNFHNFYFSNRFYVVGLDGSAPREVFADFISHQNLDAMSAAWYPDGNRISIWGWDDPGRRTPTLRSFWTVSLANGSAVRSEIAPEILERLREVSVSASGGPEDTSDVKFSWAPSGKAIYFERTFRSAKNLWKMTVDPGTLRATAIERLTTGSGLDTQLAVSADGRKLAFTGETQHVRAWLFPFDAGNGRVTGPGAAVTTSGTDAWWENLSRDGTKLVFAGKRAGKNNLWQKSLVDGHEAPILDDNYIREIPQWSPDGKRLVYSRTEYGKTDVTDLAVWSSQSHDEATLTTLGRGKAVYDWSPDGKSLLVSQQKSDTDRFEVWLLNVADAPHAEVSARRMLSDPDYDLLQSHFSPDGRWIVFLALKPSTLETRLYVTLASGGPWIQITDGKQWDDKPRWSPDGQTIYFVSGRGGVFNVWGIHFDPATGKPRGERFPVTAFDSPGPMVPRQIQDVELSLTQDKLVLTMEERSGSIWVLDNVGP
jgi:Tol biopolymer transport system component/DNA-binding winged helix-turn-helix (wHTH) protein